MTLYSVLLYFVSFIWIVFEAWLIFRDRIQGKGKVTNDRGSRYLNIAAIFLGITFASVLHGFHKFLFPGGSSDAGFFIGVAIFLVGFGLRVWAVAVLGKSFRTTVETHEDQRVVRSGPYRLLRHPSYSGLLLMCLGYGVAVQNLLSLAVAFLLPLAALLYRIRIEERALVSSLGPAYKQYQNETKKLLPWLW